MLNNQRVITKYHLQPPWNTWISVEKRGFLWITTVDLKRTHQNVETSGFNQQQTCASVLSNMGTAAVCWISWWKPRDISTLLYQIIVNITPKAEVLHCIYSIWGSMCAMFKSWIAYLCCSDQTNSGNALFECEKYLASLKNTKRKQFKNECKKMKDCNN